MDRYTLDTTLWEIYSDPLLEPLRRYLIFRPDREAPDRDHPDLVGRFPDRPLRDCGDAWAAEGVLRGLNLLAREIARGRLEQVFLYKPEDCADDPMKKDVNLIRLLPEEGSPADEGKPTVLLIGGGAYLWVSTIIESLPTAAHMVARGYSVYLLTHRVNTDKAALKALDDLAQAVKYVTHIRGDAYALGAFSAGANLICNFGVPALGYKKYGLPRPKALFPIYTFIDLKTEFRHSCVRDLLKPMFGEEAESLADEYNIIDRIDRDYPPCYIVCGRDDMSVPPYNSESLARLLAGADVPAVLEEGGHAPHAFGEGTGTDVEGWPERALDFLESLRTK